MGELIPQTTIVGMKRSAVWAFLFAGWFWSMTGTTLFAQSNEVSFDRPGVADSPFLVPADGLQLEMGWASGFNKPVPGDFLPSVLLRIRVQKSMELRWNGKYNPPLDILSDRLASDGMVLWSAGGKWYLFEQRGLRPETAIIANGFIGSGRSESTKREWGLDGYFALMNTISPRLSVNTNVGYLQFRNLGVPFLGSSCSVNWGLDEAIDCFIEGFAWRSSNGDHLEVGWDVGVTLFSRQGVQWDVSFLRSHIGGRDTESLNLGFSRRFMAR
jgi:hypothetical protein